MAPRKGGKPRATDTTSDMNRSDRKPLPVTVLSGFLGSGKTTLLRHILHSADHGLKIAVIVNDMASLNVDGNLIARTIDSQRNKDNAGEVVVKERIVQMQNGCICCTLRGDLLTELARLAWSSEGGSFDHVVIESSGISEPQQVAETFTVELTEAMIDSEGMDTEERDTFIKLARLGGLKAIATIDTMVTVLDAFRFFAEFDTAEFLQDRFGRENVPEEDQRTISDLFADQIEFANVIVINKTDMVDKNTLGRVRAYVKTLNPTAKIIETKFCKVPVRELLNTGQFDFAEAVASPGWLRSLHEMTTMEVQGKQKITPKPETLEYGIGSFVYRARKPFDPLKLYRAIEGKFILLQEELDDEEWENESNASDSMSDSETNTNNASDSDRMSEDGDVADNMIDDATILANKKASPLFRGLHRSKGIFWLATRPFQMGSWSTAGAMLTLGSEMPWFCTVPEEEWMADEFTRKAITADFEGEWGDRRQEIVLIGEKLDVDGLTKLLNSCLLSSAEMCRWEKVMHEKNTGEEEKCEKLLQMWDDSLWAEWTSAEDDEEEHDHTHHGHNHRH